MARLPKVDRVADRLDPACPHVLRVRAARAAIDAARMRSAEIPEDEIVADAARRLQELARPSLRTVLNLSGTILHTGLGRAPLSERAAEAAAVAGRDYSNLEFDLETGRRGDRQAHVRELLCEITGAEDALVVNNAAAAVTLALAAIAGGGAVAISRGQLVEIGGGFRMPEIFAQSGCRLLEVGTTNRTRPGDFLAVNDPALAALLRCHPSNYRVVGFTAEVGASEMADLAAERGVPYLDDQGNGALVDLRLFGVVGVETLPDVARFADLAMASGDKLLGGPQAGLLVGRRAVVDLVRRHPLARAFRIDKMSLAALEITLRQTRDGRVHEIPTLRDIAKPLPEVLADARRLARAIGGTVESGTTELGAGCAPGTGVPTWRVGIHRSDPDASLAALRKLDPPIIGRIERGQIWLDPRTVTPTQLRTALRALKEGEW